MFERLTRIKFNLKNSMDKNNSDKNKIIISMIM